MPGYFAPATEGPSGYRITRHTSFDGREVEVRHPDEGIARVLYERAGKVRFFVDAAGQAKNPPLIWYRKYDRRGRLLETGSSRGSWELARAHVDDPRWPEENDRALAVEVHTRSTFSFVKAFDGAHLAPGRILERTRVAEAKNMATEHWRYDARGRISAKIQGRINSRVAVEYRYDQLDAPATLIVNGREIHCDYDLAGFLAGIGGAAKAHDLASFVWAADGRLLRESRGKESVLRELSWDQWGRPVLITQTQRGKNGALLLEECLEYGADLRIARRRMQGEACFRALVFRYEHEARGRLISASSEADQTINAHRDDTLDRKYSYDAHGNLLSAVSPDSHKFTYVAGTNRLVSDNGIPEYEHGVQGRMTGHTNHCAILYDEETGLPRVGVAHRASMAIRL